MALDPPEPAAELYRVESGDTAIDLAARWYKPAGGFEQWWIPGSRGEGDARFYVTALAHANKGRAGMPSPDDLTTSDAWEDVEVITGLTIWKPSETFLNSLKGQVGSGSISLIDVATDQVVDMVSPGQPFGRQRPGTGRS